MSKKIILVDNELKLINHVLNDTDWIIEVLITINKDNQYVENDRVISIYSEEEFWNNRDLEYFDYTDLKYLWKAQLKMENTYNRFCSDFQMGKWNYYRSYALVRKIFTTHRIDFVIVKGLNHGYGWDRMITEYATFLDIASYNIEGSLYKKRIIYDNKNKKLLERQHNNVNVNEVVFYPQEVDQEVTFGKTFWERVYKFFYNHFGSLGLDFIKCVRYKNNGKDRFGNTIKDRFKMLKKIKKTKKYYDQISAEIDTTQKYICYALHYEPEASVAGRADIMDSQLVVIQMLANNLPEGWVLYVKEHTIQYWINYSKRYFNLHGLSVFKTKRMYEEISKMKNVKLLKSDSDNRLIIENCQAIATMSGTIGIEAATYKKPVLIFAAERAIYKHMNGYYKISSNEECKNAIKEILEGKECVYDNYTEICNRYLIDFSNEVCGYWNAVQIINSEILRIEQN